MKKNLCFALLASTLLVAASTHAAPSIQSSSVQHFTGRCLDAAHRSHKDVNCEISAVVKIGQQLYLANDKPIPGEGTSSLFSINFQGSPKPPFNFKSLTYLQGEPIETADKLEGLTKVTFGDASYAIATNAFTRAINPASSTVLYWPVDNPESINVLGDPNALHQQIGAVLGESFFQVEGIAVVPGNRLLLGIRRLGADYHAAKPAFIILQTPIKMTKGQIVLDGDFQVAYQFTPKVPGDDRPLGLSGLEYDPYNKRLLATTSHEDGDKIGGYLWSLPMSLLSQDKAGMPEPFLDPDGRPLWFDNKPEGVEVLSDSQILVVHDDDRVQVADSTKGKSKKDNEFAYSVITLHNDQPGL
ncbi:hypothetical protein [Pseudomonas putida]|uniref:Uncharacterized protein n=1 Tax=Pseudomonas putida TaxID=303 RepID=A0A6I6Y3A3_PSEPU|nr:hypothetical protein [Pseudomonas putida]QHG66941.1 hypothetical protein C2H86_22035 [Pseudomonas putida]